MHGEKERIWVICSAFFQVELSSGAILPRKLLKMNVVVSQDAPALVVSFQLAVLGIFYGLLNIVESRDTEGELKALIRRKLMIRRIERVTRANHD